MADYRWPNLAAMFFDQVAKHGDQPFVWAKRDGAYRPLSWGDAAARVTALSRGLRMLGIEPGDRVVLVSENRPAWLIADVAIMAAGAISVPAYTTNTEADHLHILSDCGAKGAIVSTRKLAERLRPAATKAPDLEFLIAIEPPDIDQVSSFDLHSLDAVQNMGKGGHENVVEMAGRWKPDDTACIIYTSGTGGAPKGVMLSHKAIMHNCAGAEDALADIGLGNETFLSFLPLSHSYEHSAGQFFPISIGAEIYYAEGVETLASNMIEAKPTIMTAVPRLYEMLYQRITAGVRKTGGTKEKLFNKALTLGTKRYQTGRLGLIENIQNAVLEKLVRNKVRGRFGGRLKALVSGGAPLNPDLGTFFTALGLRILQGYGQTETAPVVSVNRAYQVKMHTVGPPLIDTEVKIADDGEILVRGDLVMQGYWGKPDATRETIIDGWVHTGDIGTFDDDGHLMITDRKKDIIVNSGGDNLAPQRIEGIICLEAEIAQAMVYGDKRPHIVALLVPDADWLKEWARAAGKTGSLAELAGDDDLRKALVPAMDRINAGLSNIEKVRRFMIADEPFSIDNAQMTPTMKVRRHKLIEDYGERLVNLYG
ncbi:MAG: long-chain fatty acid--CoA ligase [Rhodospirillaceae bacterium]|jgi:long-chain acyl-CoA synthetase|nr:long-chain fatty acid--CoA ligase [Rhodospirillaceae bacterium]